MEGDLSPSFGAAIAFSCRPSKQDISGPAQNIFPCLALACLPSTETVPHLCRRCSLPPLSSGFSAMYFSTASSLPSRATASFQQSSQVQPWRGSSGGKFSGFQTWQPSRLRISGPGSPLALAASALVSSGMPRMSKNSSFERLGGRFCRPLAVFQGSECGGGKSGQSLAEWQFPVNPIESLWDRSCHLARSSRSHPAPGHRDRHRKRRFRPAAAAGLLR